MKPGSSSFMERRVKERLVGATILVVLVVLIVPELLSGPKRPPVPAAHSDPAPEATRVVTVDLATSKATPVDEAAAPDAAPAEAPREPEPGAAASKQGAPPMLSTLQAQRGSDAVENAPPPRAAAVPAKPATHESQTDNSRHQWALQLGSFANKSNADNLSQRLRAQGFPAVVSPEGSGASLRYRVRVGPVADRAAAEHVMAHLKKIGHPASIVTP